MMSNYILVDAQPVQEPDVIKWSDWFEASMVEGINMERLLASTQVGDVRVSTVFLAIDHNFADDGQPVLWETMTFYGDSSEEEDLERYTSRAEALAGHDRMVRHVQRWRWQRPFWLFVRGVQRFFGI